MEAEPITQTIFSGNKGHGRGFASLDTAQRRAIASLGGKTAQALGKAHKFSPAEARVAGQKGGRSRKEREMPTVPITANQHLSTAS